VTLFGFSGGTAMAGGLLLDDPAAYAGAVLLAGTLPFDAELPTDPQRLSGVRVFYGRGTDDTVIPLDLIDRTRAYLSDDSGCDLTLREYAGLGHGLDQRVAADVAAFLA
jgi:phospholipase/carboxylesterase